MDRETKLLLTQMLDLDEESIPEEVVNLYESVKGYYGRVRAKSALSCEVLAMIVTLASSKPKTQSGEDRRAMLRRMANMRNKKGKKKGSKDGRVEPCAKP